MKLLAAVLLCLWYNPSSAQDYTGYQRLFNRIDNDLLSEQYSTASQRLDSVLQQYPFIYARHCLKGLQISCAAGDFVRADRWLQQCFLRGVPLWIIRGNALTTAVFSNPQTAAAIARYDSLHKVYESGIDRSLQKTIDSLYAIDQRKTGRVNDGFLLFRHTLYGLQWLHNNRRQAAVLKRIIETRGFPGERLIGLPAYQQDSAQNYPSLLRDGPVLVDQRAYVMLLHYYSSPRRGMNEPLLSSVMQGYLPPAWFGAINDFMAAWGKGRYGQYEHYNVWHNDSNPDHTAAIDARREGVGLRSLGEQERFNAIYRERRRDRVNNARVVLE